MTELHHYRRTDLPVLMLANLDPCWDGEDIQESISLTENLTTALKAVGHPVSIVYVETGKFPELVRHHFPDDLVVFNWCEELPGVPYSGAQVALELEQRGFVYTGAAVHALELSQNKCLIKDRLQRSGVSTPAWQVVSSHQEFDWTEFPAIVKPAHEHCSFGITREAVVQSPAELSSRIHYVLEELKQPAIIEDFIDGREFHVGVVGNGVLRVLPPAEIDYTAYTDIHDRLCTYESNFDKDSLAYQLTIPKLSARLTQEQLSKLQDVVISAYRATDCRDYARMDIRLRDGVFYVLDVNHNADISPDTSLVMSAEMIGYSYGQFGSLLVNLAAQRNQARPDG